MERDRVCPSPGADGHTDDGVPPATTFPRLGLWWPILVVVLPFLVLAVLLIVVRDQYRPISDYALTEMQVRNIGSHEVLTGLYSRSDWAHPGPIFFYLIAPFYWITGGASIGMNLAAVAINAAAVVGIGVIAWRRGGTAMLLCALVGCALVMRTMGAEFLYDPWNNYVVTLPYGLLLFATWAMLCDDRWALPIATIVASFLAQTHVGYVVLALPLVALGAAWLVLPTLRRGADVERRRGVLRSLTLSAAIAFVLWLPPAFDLLTNRPSNLGKARHYFATSDEPTQTVTSGWRIVSGQFTWPPEWLTSKRIQLTGYGESPFKLDSALPWLLVPVVLAAVYLWRRRRDDTAGARYLPVVLGAAMALGILAVARTLGPLLDYRLRWTWMPPLLAFVLVAWTGWQLAVRRWPGAERRVLVPLAVAAIVVLTGVNVVTAATVQSPWKADSEVTEHITREVRQVIDADRGQVVLTDFFSDAAWYTRGLVLALERAGFDARVPPDRGVLFGKNRVRHPDRPVQASLVVVMGNDVEKYLEKPGYRLVARWRPAPDSTFAEQLRQRAKLDRAFEAGRLDLDEFLHEVTELMPGPPHNPVASDLAVFIEE